MSGDTATARLSDHADAIVRWVHRGGTQDRSGAFCGWLDARTGKLSDRYPEITGYALTFVAHTAAEPGTVGPARAAADWLATRTESGCFAARPTKLGNAVYTFDVAMVAHGLLQYGRMAGVDRYVAAGLRNVELLLRQYEVYGTLQCLLPDATRAPIEPTWSSHGQVHLLKAVQALLNASDLGVDGAQEAARTLVREVLDGWDDATEIPATCPGDARVSLHALCYAAEGLWVWMTRTDDGQARGASRAITEWVWRHALDGGGFPAYVSTSGHRVDRRRQSDVLAQALRLARLHGLAGGALEATTARLIGDLWRGGDEAALYYRPDSDERHLNAWASMFAAQALRLCVDPRSTLQPWELV